ncbi:hypothetical protein ACFE04_021604 [Oxalis oulophora]
MAKCAAIEPFTITMDLRGTDGRERGKQNKVEVFSENVDKSFGSATENGSVSYNIGSSYVPSSEPPQEQMKRKSWCSKEEAPLPKREYGLRLDKLKSSISDIQNSRDEKFQIDLIVAHHYLCGCVPLQLYMSAACVFPLSSPTKVEAGNTKEVVLMC